MKQYFLLLQQNPIIRRLTLIQLIAYFGAWFSNVAIFTLLVQFDVSASVIALVAALHFLPGVVQAPFTGVIIDRISPKRLMLFLILTEMIATALLLAVTDTSLLWLLFVLVFIRMAGASFYFTAEMSLLPKILDERSLERANTLHSMVWSLSYTLGMAISGIVVAFVGVYTAIVIDVLFFFTAFWMMWTLHIAVEIKPSGKHFFKEFVDGVLYLKSQPKIVSLLVLHAVVGFTALDALVVLLAKHHYAAWVSVPLAIGSVHAVRALALIIGPVLLSRYINKERLVYLLLFQGVTFIVWALHIEDYIYSIVLSFFVGLALTTLWAFTYTLIQIYTDEHYYGRVISYNDMLFLLVSGLTSLGIGWLYDAGLSLAMITVVLGVLFLLAALYYMWIKKRFLRD